MCGVRNVAVRRKLATDFLPHELRRTPTPELIVTPRPSSIFFPRFRLTCTWAMTAFCCAGQGAGATVVIKPMDLARYFRPRAVCPSSSSAPQRQAYRLVELERWGAFLNVPIIAEPNIFPCPADACVEMGDRRGGSRRIQDIGLHRCHRSALWAEQRNPRIAGTLAALATASGLDANAIGHQADAASTPRAMTHGPRKRWSRGVRRAYLCLPGRIVLGSGPARLPGARTGKIAGYASCAGSGQRPPGRKKHCKLLREAAAV